MNPNITQNRITEDHISGAKGYFRRGRSINSSCSRSLVHFEAVWLAIYQNPPWGPSSFEIITLSSDLARKQTLCTKFPRVCNSINSHLKPSKNVRIDASFFTYFAAGGLRFISTCAIYLWQNPVAAFCAKQKLHPMKND